MVNSQIKMHRKQFTSILIGNSGITNMTDLIGMKYKSIFLKKNFFSFIMQKIEIVTLMRSKLEKLLNNLKMISI